MRYLVCYVLGQVTVTYSKAPTREEIKRLRGEGDNINSANFRFERSQVLGFREGRRRE